MNAWLAALLVTVLEPLDAEKDQLAAVSITFAAYSSDAAAVGLGTANGSRIRIESAWLAVQDTRIRVATSGCKRGATRALAESAFSAELVRKHTLDPARIAAERYCAFEMQVRRSRAKVAGAPAELRGASIVVVGTRLDGTPFVVQSRIEQAAVLRARSLEGFAATAPTTSWIIGVDVARWFAGVDVGAGEPSGDTRARVVRIDEKHNPELLAAFNANVANSFALFDDVNQDRILDTEEQSRPIASSPTFSFGGSSAD